jgi:hypothetical protein
MAIFEDVYEEDGDVFPFEVLPQVDDHNPPFDP